MGAVRKVTASLPSLPKITYKGQAVGVNSAVGAVKVASTQVAKPLEKIAAASVAVLATTLTGVPVTPKMVNDAATGIKVNTYDKPTSAATVIPTSGGNTFSGALGAISDGLNSIFGGKPADATATTAATPAKVNWWLIGGGVLLIGGVTYAMTRGK